MPKKDIHPKYFKVKAGCVCGATIETGSTMAEIRLDVCSQCHPFYTGTQRLMDIEGRVEKFKKRYGQAG
jgi:large subunit ribosomal protein L31